MKFVADKYRILQTPAGRFRVSVGTEWEVVDSDVPLVDLATRRISRDLYDLHYAPPKPKAKPKAKKVTKKED